MMIRAYLRASTKEQDATRAKEALSQFVQGKGLNIGNWYAESESGTKEKRQQLDQLIEDSEESDFLLIEKMDRLTRLPWEQWETLKARITAKKINIVVMDQPMTHTALISPNEVQSAITKALTAFMLDLGAAMARDDYETRRQRQRQGIDKAMQAGRYKGKQRTQATIDKYNKAIDFININGLKAEEAYQAAGMGRATFFNMKKEYNGERAAL
jgi:DNA invertase Pin-like site-specific DNA recombinase